MYQLLNEMVGGDERGKLVSQHRTLVAAIKANDKLQRKVKANNGASSYLPVAYRKDWSPVDVDEFDAALCEAQKQ